MSGSSSNQARLVAAAKVIVDMVDSGEASSSKSLVESLEEAAKKNPFGLSR